MILYSVYNIIIHVTFLFLTLSVLFSTIIKENIQNIFYDKTKHLRILLNNEVYIKDKKAINNRWWITIYALNFIFITTSLLMTGALSLLNKTNIFETLISNIITSTIVIIIQLFIINFIKFSHLGPVDFELIILDELKNKL